MVFEKGMSETKKKFHSFRQLIKETGSLVNRYVFLPYQLGILSGCLCLPVIQRNDNIYKA